MRPISPSYLAVHHVHRPRGFTCREAALIALALPRALRSNGKLALDADARPALSVTPRGDYAADTVMNTPLYFKFIASGYGFIMQYATGRKTPSFD